MADLIRKVLYTGVGLVTTTAERVQKSINELVEAGKLSEEEGKKVVDDLVTDTENKRDEFETKLRDMVGNIMRKLDSPRRDDIDALQTRIAELEAKLAETAEKASVTVEKEPVLEKTTATRRAPAKGKDPVAKKGAIEKAPAK